VLCVLGRQSLEGLCNENVACSNVNQARIMQAQQIAAGAGDWLKIWNMIFDDSKATAAKTFEALRR